MSVARRTELTPADADFELMHHALGRPAGPHEKPYRNYFACDPDGPDAKRFTDLGHYSHRGGRISGGLVAFHVTPHGLDNVMAWLLDRQRRKGLRPWIVSGGGLTARTVIARSAAAAKYDVYLALNDLSIWRDFHAFLTSGVRARPS